MREHQTDIFPKRLAICAIMMIVFGLAEIVTSFTHRFLGLTTAQLTTSTIIGASIGTFLFCEWFSCSFKKKNSRDSCNRIVIRGRIRTGFNGCNRALSNQFRTSGFCNYRGHINRNFFRNLCLATEKIFQVKP
jgi:hypothetical protein